MNASKPLENVACADNHDAVAIGILWFETAFDVAVGSSITEVCHRFSEDLRAVLALKNAATADRRSPEEILDLVQTIQWRLSVAAEWSERIDKANSESGARS